MPVNVLSCCLSFDQNYSSLSTLEFRVELANYLRLVTRRKFVSVPGHDRRHFEILGRWWRLRAPLESRQMPRIRFGVLAVAHRPDEVDRGNQHAETENRCAGGGEHVEHLELRRVRVITTRHAEVTGDELRQKRQVEADENYQRTETAPAFGIQASGDLGPPVMQTAEVSHQSAANHDVVEVSDDEVSVAQVHVDRERGEKQSRHAADSEQQI